MNISLFHDSARRLYAQRKDLQTAFPNPESVEYWAWCHSHGVAEDSAVAEFAPPLPPEELRALVGSGSSAHDFLIAGASSFLSVCAIANLNESRSLLDFGCGCGRLLRFFPFFSGRLDLVGVDVEPRHIQWDSRHLTFASFSLNDRLPPLPFPANRFDTIVCLSVFSHLPEATHRAWMGEFARLLAPRGRIIVTVLGSTAVQATLRDRSCLAALDISWTDFSVIRSEFSQRGFSFVGQLAHSLEDYGIALASEAWMRECWGPDFEVLTYRQGWFDGWQDGYVLRRRFQ
jgi:SAM-dependent methyltransferase